MSRSHLDEAMADVLREFGNVGAGHAATALSILMHERVTMSVTDARLCPFNQITEVVGGPDTIVAAVFIRITGQIEGSMFVLLTLHSVERLLATLLGSNLHEDDYTELELSAVAEVGNILSGAYITAISGLCGIQLHQSVPSVAIDMAGAILDIGFMLNGTDDDEAILISTSLGLDNTPIDGHFFLLPAIHGTSRLLEIFQEMSCHGA